MVTAGQVQGSVGYMRSTVAGSHNGRGAKVRRRKLKKRSGCTELSVKPVAGPASAHGQVCGKVGRGD
jgi:hypothetical protein